MKNIFFPVFFPLNNCCFKKIWPEIKYWTTRPLALEKSLGTRSINPSIPSRNKKKRLKHNIFSDQLRNIVFKVFLLYLKKVALTLS